MMPELSGVNDDPMDSEESPTPTSSSGQGSRSLALTKVEELVYETVACLGFCSAKSALIIKTYNRT